MTLQPIGPTLAIEDAARSLAHQHRLIDETGQLHCWNCKGPCAWHVSLHCYLCKAESLRTAPDRRRAEYQQRKLAESQVEPSRPQQRVAGRRFGDDY